MKSKLFFSIFLILTISLVGCQLKENYSMQYSFSTELVTETKLETKSDGIILEIPFADASCDLKSLKAELDRDENTFALTIAGTETTERCSQKFSADITGIQPGNYWLKVIYDKAGDKQQVLYREFSITK